MDQDKEVKDVLKTRNSNYGNYTDDARTAMALQDIITEEQNKTGVTIPPFQRHALQMITTKLARIACGNPNHRDSWLDIAGYSQLVLDRLEDQDK